MRRMAVCILLACTLAFPARGAEKQKLVALTFDDGPSGQYTRVLLEGLRKREARATFLLCGYRMEQYPDLTQEIFDAGHEIGYHGFTHDSMRTMSRMTIARELMDTQALLPEGCEPAFFRPPGGLVTDGVRQVAQARLLSILSWSVDPKDWATEDTGAIESAVFRNVRDGDIILLHDMTMSSVRAALDIVDALQKQGYRFVTVSEMARLREVRLRPGQTYRHFHPEEEPVK